MFNYNVINPVNIHYRKYPQNEGIKKSENENEEKKKPNLTPDENDSNKRFPNGNKVAIDYTKNQINIAQVIQDFKSTIAAINSPKDVKEEVELYLDMVTKETKKEAPSKEIVLSNLKNAARITDKYIQDSLKKPSKVVQDWVDALFLQKINLKADENEINEEFRVKIPEKKETKPHTGGLTPLKEDKFEYDSKEQYTNDVNLSYENAGNNFVTVNPAQEEIKEAKKDDTIETTPQITKPENELYLIKTENEERAKDLLLMAKKAFEEGSDMYSTLKLYDEAIESMEGSENKNLKSAIYFERGKIFDSYDYAELALIDYHKATKSSDNNLKAQAHIKMGNIYDDYVQFDPAMDQYTRAIESLEEVNNLQGKTRALRYIASMFAGIYDKENTEAFSNLAIESAKESKNPKTISNTYLDVAKNYAYIGEDSKALNICATFAKDEATKDSYSELAKNYMEASMLMDKKGNKKKAYALMVKSKEYNRLAKLKEKDEF